jgi:hypothetical protein
MARLQGNDLDFNNSSRIVNLPAATAAGHPVTFEQLNSAVEGLAWKDSARVATQGNLNLASPGSSIDGVTLVAGDRVLVKAQTAPAENGVYVWNGAAVAMTRAADASTGDELEAAIVPVEEGTNAGTLWRQTAVNFTLGTGAVSFVQFGTSAPAATETTAGILEVATQAETDAGASDAVAVTPQKLAAWAGRARKAAANIGDGSGTQFDVTHNFNTLDVRVEVYRNASPYDTINCDVERPSVNAVRLRFSAPPGANQFRVLVLA